MLERATAGLESCRFQRILAGSGRSFSSCRRLHSALWRHAAAASSHPPPLTCPRAACARLRRPPPAALPPPDSTRRCFTSSARVAAPPPEAPEPSSEAAKTDPARPGTAAGGTPRPVDTIEYVDDSSLFASQLTELLSHPDQERYEDAWDLYCRLEPSQREPVVEFVALYLSRSDRVDDARRIVSLLKTIPSESWSEQLQSVFIRAAIRSGQVDLALARFQTGLEQGRLSGGLEYILVDLLLHHRWPTLLKVWADHMRCRGPESPGETLLDSAQYLHFQTLPDMGKLYLLFERYLEGEGSGPAQAVNFYPDSRRGLAELRRVLAAAALSRPCPLREAAAILEIQADGQLYESYILHQLDRWRRGLETKSALAILQDLFRMYRALPGAAPSVDLLHGMLDLCSPNNVAAVEDLYRDWHAFHVEPDQAGYEKFLDFYAGAGDTDAVKLLWARYAARFPEAVRQPAGFWAVVKAYASAGDVEGAQGELQRMRDQYGVEPDLAIWNSMLKCYMRAEEPTRMLETFDEVRKTHQPDSTTYGIVMALAAKRGDLDAVHKLFEQAQNEEVAVGGEMSVALVTAYCQNDRLVAAENLCKELSVRKEASLTAWNQLLYFTGAHHKLAKCHELLQTIKKHGFEWDAETYRALLNAFVKVGQLQPAWRLLRSAVNDKLFPVGVEHFEVVIRRSCP
ncbi:hypothetical protein CDD83_4300 [Cordyceps sp. RAO-2017]|nr:hypothetical protein CDD83_4300 [Cordyceps sp. RAO-2017]